MSNESDEELRPLLQDYRSPPPFPAGSLWRGIEAAEEGREPGGRATLRLPHRVAAAAAVALFAGGALLGSILQVTLRDPGVGASPGIEQTGMRPGGPADVRVADASHVIWF